MEPIGAEGQWSSLSGIYTAEEADFMALLLNNCSSQNEPSGNLNFSLEMSSTNLYNFSLGSTNSYSDEQYCLSGSQPISVTNTSLSVDFCVGDDDCLNQGTSDHSGEDDLQLMKKGEIMTVSEAAVMEDKSNPSENPMKRSLSYDNFQIEKKYMKPKKKQKLVSTSRNEEEEGKGNPNKQSSSGCCSGEDCSQELSGGVSSSLSPKGLKAINSEGKSRARRGSATDPQSLYARKRRERINERLRILQTLVPNGTKVDISTMLEEAVQYVKFLQLQIKLLSSDKLWKYAPIAYNGKDIGIDYLNLAALAKHS
ncbi:hypothetical protein UlMin_031116 [Ulmus minor]